MKLGQMTNLNVIFHMVGSFYRLVTIRNSPQFPVEFRNGLDQWSDRAEKRLRMRHWRPCRPISFEIAQSARHLARKYRLEQHIPNERPSSFLTSQ